MLYIQRSSEALQRRGMLTTADILSCMLMVSERSEGAWTYVRCTLNPRILKTVVQGCRVPILPGKRRSSAIQTWEPEAM